MGQGSLNVQCVASAKFGDDASWIEVGNTEVLFETEVAHWVQDIPFNPDAADGPFRFQMCAISTCFARFGPFVRFSIEDNTMERQEVVGVFETKRALLLTDGGKRMLT